LDADFFLLEDLADDFVDFFLAELPLDAGWDFVEAVSPV